jgi:hypothetical protein
LCYITYDTDSPEEFLNKFADGDFDDFLDEKMGVTFADAPAKLRIDHTGHNHPATPAGRAACRKAGGSDGSLMTAPRTIVEKPPATPPIRKTITPGRKMTVDEFKARQARLGLGPKPVEVPSPITHQHDHSHPHPYDDEARTRVRQSVVHHSVKIRRDEVFEALDHEGEIMGGEVMGKLRVVDTVKKADINAQYYQGIGRLQIEQTFLKGGPRVHEGFLRSQRSGYKTKVADGVTPLQRTLTHEMGHHVESVIMGPYGMAVRESVFNEIADSLGLPRPVLHTRTGMDKWVKRYYAKIHKEVSAYGATNSAEMLAEIWTEYSRGGTKMRPHIKRIGRLIEKYLREYTAP